MPNPLQKLIQPRFPTCAAGIETGEASVVQLDRSRGGFVVTRAASVALPPDVVQASFDEPNLKNPDGLRRALTDLITSAGMLRQRKWSVALPEAATRSAIITIEGASASRREIEEVFEWKIERTFGASSDELQLSREELSRDAQRQTRFLVNAVRLSVLAEYEAVLASLGWHAGLILPRHVGEEQWLRNGHPGNGLLLTSHGEGFTAVLMHGNRPLSLRSVFCDAAECDDELHRILLFYGDRANAGAAADMPAFDRLLVLGDFLDKKRVEDIAADALGVRLKPLNAEDVGLMIPGDLEFDTIAAPAGLARLAW